MKAKEGVITILITDATGFIGQQLAHFLLENKLNQKKVRLIFIARNPKKLSPKLKKEFFVIQSSLEELAALKSWALWEELDYVLHFAAEVKIAGKKSTLKASNIEGTKQLIERLAKSKKLQRFILASSVGAVDRLKTEKILKPLTEEQEPNPLTYYGKTKLESELLVKQSGLNYTIIRIPWAFGPGMTADTHVNKLSFLAQKNHVISKINFPGKVSLLPVEDLCQMIKFCLEEEKTKNETFFIKGQIKDMALADIFKLTKSLYGHQSRTLEIPKIIQALFKATRPLLPLVLQNLHDDVLCVSDKKIRALGFKAETDFHTSFQKMLHANNQPYNEEVFLVTGAASGIGEALARSLYVSGKSLILVDRKDLSSDLKKQAKVVLKLDLTQKEDLEQLEKQVQEEKRLAAVINCAGIGEKTTIQKMSQNKIEKMLALNCLATAKLSKLAIDRFVKQKKGILINISSTTAIQPFPFFAIYAASKSFVSFMTRAMMVELKDDARIKIVDVLPSGVDTNFQENAKVKKRKDERLLSPEEVAGTISRLITKNKKSGTYYIGNKGPIQEIMARVLPKQMNNVYGVDTFSVCVN